jgi:cardiolipin synthase
MLAQLPTEVREYLVTILKLDPEVARRQNFNHSPLKLYVLFSTHRREPEATRSPVAGQIENAQSTIHSPGLLIDLAPALSRPTPITIPAEALATVEEPESLVGGNRVQLLRNGSQAFPVWLAAIDAARTTISIEMYIFNDDAIGRRFADALSRAARRGVTVRLLYDSVGCRHNSPIFFENMRQAGAWVVAYHPYRFWRPHFWTLLRRNHRKTLVCDGTVAFTGGLNISDRWTPPSEGGWGWHDAAIEVRGPAVPAIEAVFLRTWNWRVKRRMRIKARRPVKAHVEGNAWLTVIANRELLDRFAIRRAALHAIRASKRRIYLVSPYFLPDPGFIRSLAAAVLRRVDVRVLVPKQSDTTTVDLASHATFGRLLQAGVRIFQHAPVVHTKALLVDDDFVSIGSYNFDHRSLAYNLEMVVNLLDREINGHLADMLEAEMAAGREIDWTVFRRRSLLLRILERIAYAFRHWF